MTKLPTGRPILPFTPTVDPSGDPTCCFACGMRAVALGINHQKGDPSYLCRRCIVAIDDYKKIRRLDDYELAALDGGVDAVGEWIAERGIGTELSVYDELDQRMLVKAAVVGFAERLRKLISEGSAPF